MLIIYRSFYNHDILCLIEIAFKVDIDLFDLQTQYSLPLHLIQLL